MRKTLWICLDEALETSFRSSESQCAPGVWGTSRVVALEIEIKKLKSFQPQNGRSNSTFGLCGTWASRIVAWQSRIVTIQLKCCQIQKPRGQESSHRFLASRPVSRMIWPRSWGVPPVSLHKWCGSRLLVLIIGANILIDESLLMWLFFLIAAVLCQEHEGGVGWLRRDSPWVTGSTGSLVESPWATLFESGL